LYSNQYRAFCIRTSTEILRLTRRSDENDINDSLESWMSGHSTAAFA
jgi:hypothetical protein